MRRKAERGCLKEKRQKIKTAISHKRYVAKVEEGSKGRQQAGQAAGASAGRKEAVGRLQVHPVSLTVALFFSF